MIQKLIILSLVLLMSQKECDADDHHGLVQHRRSFLKHDDEDQQKSYLASFGENPTPAESQRHEVFKRSSSMRKVRKSKKVATTTEASVEAEIPTKPLAGKNNGNKNFTQVSPRHVVKFELDDAKYSEEYEKLKRSRKLRVKRSSDGEKKTNGTKKFITKETFMQPRELFRFSYLDAVTNSPAASETKEVNESNQKKAKREIADSIATDTKKIHVSHPMRGYRSTKHVSYDDISNKLQKMIDHALHDAVLKGKANDGDYLKFFYGDKIIKVPVSLSKYISSKGKETSATISAPTPTPEYVQDPAYVKETKVYPKETLVYVTKPPAYIKESTVYGKKPAVKENSNDESPKLLTTINSYYQLKNTGIRYKQPKYPNFLTTTEKAESYANFETPINVQPENQENKYEPYQKSVYYYTTDGIHYPKNSLSSPGPVLFEEPTPTTPNSISEAPSSHHYKNYIYHPPTKVSNVKDATPIIEHVNEDIFDYIPEVAEKSHLPIPAPTSYVEYAGNHDDLHDQAKSYEFGYHVSDYKTGNNYGHTQKSNKEETKGEYSLLLPDGRVQTVKYYANDSGFHADVSYQNVH